MYLLYVDESGHILDNSQRHFVLVGISVHEKKTHWLEKDLNLIASSFDQDYDAIELHGSPMMAGKGSWRKYLKEERIDAIKKALNIVKTNYGKNVRLFAAVIDKSKVESGDVSEIVFEQISTRFDHFLKRIHNRYEDDQRGIMIFDEPSTEKPYNHYQNDLNMMDIHGVN
jgi:hypothetical protein